MSQESTTLPRRHSVQASGDARPSTAPGDKGPEQVQPSTPTSHTPSKLHDKNALAKPAHQRFVLTDPVAFRYLEEDPSTTVLERRRELHGYECYIVEQWTTSRTHPTFVITTYTGDPLHVVVVGVLSVPTDESTWSPRLRVYFKALNQYHARRKETALGVLMVTNLSGFPSSLTVVAVPDGDLRKHRFDFFVNENLKRLGCSGRVGLMLVPPALATIAKFHQLYKVSDKNDIYKSVIELIKLCQSALMLFDKLSVDYADGLLCDITERALNEWWIDIGSEHYNIEPHDGILGPTTVAALLGLLMGARNRLHAVNAPVPKDPFDIEAMKQGLGAFQKQQRLPRSRRLDRRTLDRLHKASQKAADKEHWLVPKAVKSTVAELSGKGGEMVMDVVGRKDRAGIAEVETVDIERFTQLAYGDRCKWLWQGKPMKKSRGDLFGGASEETNDGLPPSRAGQAKLDERGKIARTLASRSTADGNTANLREAEQQLGEVDQQHVNEADDSDEAANKASMLQRATNLRNEAKSGINKVRDAVGFRGHRAKPSVDDHTIALQAPKKETRRPLLQRAHSSPYHSPPSIRSQDRERHNESAVAMQSARLSVALEANSSGNLAQASEREYDDGDQDSQTTEQRRISRQPSISGTVDTAIRDQQNGDMDSDTSRPSKQDARRSGGVLLQRTVSYGPSVGGALPQKLDEAFPRHLSFSLAEESVLKLELPDEQDADAFYTNRMQLAEEEFIAKEAKHLRSVIDLLSSENAVWTKAQLRNLESLLQEADGDQETIESLHVPHLESVQALQRESEGLLTQEQAALEEGSKALETLVARLDYEIDGLRGKVEDVEAAVSDFEKGVSRVEERVVELEAVGEKGSGWTCIVA